jgi:hypothetical protein
LSSNDVGKRVRICGWVALHRVHGGLTFLNLRDHTGIVQVPALLILCFLSLKIQFLIWSSCCIVLNSNYVLNSGYNPSRWFSTCTFCYQWCQTGVCGCHWRCC